ncbi:PREDICTED: basic salivary proline-rich protein 3-like [Vollenhovia emeryi]|uniref:basic salivary proline-rich protein 3-like n=1 Tax=Vollenhovia emeryi TaxID=411798 RepID=UPI0005F3BF27|nr:PREDICTED: basic salivary proline-rich protein 3-like [Vollenhovia emeryi]
MARAGGKTRTPALASLLTTPKSGFRGSQSSDSLGTVGAPPRRGPRGRMGYRGRPVPPSPCPPRRPACSLLSPGQTPARSRGPSRESPRLGTMRVVTPSKAPSSEGLPPQVRGERHPRPQRQPPASGPPDPDLGIRPSGSGGSQATEPRLGNVRAASAARHLVRTGRADALMPGCTPSKGRHPETQGTPTRDVRGQDCVTAIPAPSLSAHPATRTTYGYAAGVDPPPPPRQDHVQPSDGRATPPQPKAHKAGAPACNELQRGRSERSWSADARPKEPPEPKTAHGRLPVDRPPKPRHHDKVALHGGDVDEPSRRNRVTACDLKTYLLLLLRYNLIVDRP